MTSGYILIVAILVLGGVLATLGDRIGTKVGKARLSLFKMRPRKTATVVTIITGSLISASTLAILFASSRSLRDGVFELDNILRKLRIARGEIEIINAQKDQIESELAKVRKEQAEVQKRLEATNQKFQLAQTQLKKVTEQATALRAEIISLLDERQELIDQRQQLTNQIEQLKIQVTQLKELVTQRDQELVKRNQLLEQRNQTIEERNQEIAKQDRELNQQDEVIAQREARLQQVETQLDEAIAQIEKRQEVEQQLKEAIVQREARLQELEQLLSQREVQLAERDKQLEEREKQLAYLEEDVEVLVKSYRVLRQGNVAILRDQVLASGVVRVLDPEATPEAINQLLREANRNAIQITRAPNNATLVQITQSQVEQLVKQIKDGQDYVVRILSAGNYVEGEPQVQVFADAVPNQIVFEPGDVLAAVSVDSSTMSNQQIRQRLDQLLAASEFRARRALVLNEKIQVGDGRLLTLIRFIQKLEQFDQPLEVRAVAQDTTYTAGPLKMNLVALLNGEVVFTT